MEYSLNGQSLFYIAFITLETLNHIDPIGVTMIIQCTSNSQYIIYNIGLHWIMLQCAFIDFQISETIGRINELQIKNSLILIKQDTTN